jgi:hypothetical protein
MKSKSFDATLATIKGLMNTVTTQREYEAVDKALEILERKPIVRIKAKKSHNSLTVAFHVVCSECGEEYDVASIAQRSGLTLRVKRHQCEDRPKE